MAWILWRLRRWVLNWRGTRHQTIRLGQRLIIWLIAAILVAVLPSALPMATQHLGLAVLFFPASGAFLLGLGAAINYAHLRARVKGRIRTPGSMSRRRRVGLGVAAVLSVFLLIGTGVSTLSAYTFWQVIHSERLSVSCGPVYADVKEDAFKDREWWDPSVTVGSFGEIQSASGELAADVLIVTANHDEWAQVARVMVEAPASNVRSGDFVFTLGSFGGCTAALVQCSQGSGGQTASQIAVLDGIALAQPKLVLCLGGAFGASRQSQAPGDVLVSSCVVPYEHQKVCCDGLVWEWRGSDLPARTGVVALFDSPPGWDFEGLPGKRVLHYTGPVVSGEKLVNSAQLKCVILQSCCPDAIGGEMEGVGVAVVANHAGIPWVVVKGVMDWGDGLKNDAFKQLASAAAVSYALRALDGAQAPAALAAIAVSPSTASCSCSR